MSIGDVALTNLKIALNAVFNGAFKDANILFDRLAMTVPSSSPTLDYMAILDWPGVKEWLGDRQLRSLVGVNMQVTAKDWESTIVIKKNDIDDDQLGLYTPKVAMMGTMAKQHPNILLATLISNGTGTTYGACYDGKAFFATDHIVGDGASGSVTSFSNYDSGASTGWYLFSTQMPVKPFVFQLRQNFQMTSKDSATDDNTFMRKEYYYGVDARYNMAYALPQLAYKSTQTLNATNFASAIAAMESLKNMDGVPLGISPNLLVVPPTLRADAKELLEGDLVVGALASGGTTDYVGGGKTNVWKGFCDLLVLSELA